jgi:hypothetical protein
MRWVETLAIKQLLDEVIQMKKRLLAWSGLSVSLPVGSIGQILMKFQNSVQKL